MAGDWIKMRSDLFTHPKVVRISSALKADTLRTVGGLMSVWCLFDAHSIDGKLEGYTSQTLDDHLRWPGFSAAMISVGWLVDDGESLALPEFDTHNGQSAKRRAQDADRKKAVRKTSASEADKKRTREEKRREEKKAKAAIPSPIDFKADLFARWKALPDGGGGAFLNKLFRDHKPELAVIEAVERTLDESRADPKAFVLGILRAPTQKRVDGETLDELMARAI
ncbi:hypothetical protein [Rhodanobacter caeni]|uniref:Uncharacterized protein n=1 Tax=Rhodanobacter caeni TaxID=657654 RepID=A0ABN0USW1_9GAMM